MAGSAWRYNIGARYIPASAEQDARLIPNPIPGTMQILIQTSHGLRKCTTITSVSPSYCQTSSGGMTQSSQRSLKEFSSTSEKANHLILTAPFRPFWIDSICHASVGPAARFVLDSES